jgi:hypothetical protein
MHRDASDTNAVILNVENSLTRQAAYFERWVQRQLYHYLVSRKFGYVDTAFLARGMQMDNGCKELNIGQDRSSAIALLEAGAEARLIVRKTMPHPKHPDVRITVWSLPGDDDTTEPQEPNQPGKPKDEVPANDTSGTEVPTDKPQDHQTDYLLHPTGF